MSGTSEVAPDTLSIDLTEGGIEVEYTDGREAFYHGVPEQVEQVTTPPGKDTHVLVTNADGTHGVLTYVNERTTEDDILEDSGVGRVLLDRGEETSIFPGVTVQESEMRITVRADLTMVDGRVFVFAEDEMGEASYELVDQVPGSADGVDEDEPAGKEESAGEAEPAGKEESGGEEEPAGTEESAGEAEPTGEEEPAGEEETPHERDASGADDEADGE